MIERLKKQNAFIIVLEFSLIILVIIGISYAAYNFRHNFNLKTINLGIDTDVYGDTKIDSDNIKLVPILDQKVDINQSNVLKIPFKVRGNKDNVVNNIIYDIALVNLNIDCELLSKYLKWELIKNDEVISSGDFSSSFDTIVDNRLVLTEIQQDLVDYSAEPDNYEFRLWLSDSCQNEQISECQNSEDQSNLLNKSISGRIEVELYTGSRSKLERQPSNEIIPGSCVQNLDESGANKPAIDDSMVAVYYDDNQGVWRKADFRNGNQNYLWYDYNNKKWANAVIVKDYKKYEESTLGSEILDSDIVAFYVWIPRYRYQVWNINGESEKSQNYKDGIKIEFEFGKSDSGEITCAKDKCIGNNGEWITHPAFVNKNAKGFWIAKYQTKGSDSAPKIIATDSSLTNYSKEEALSTSLKLMDYGITTLDLELMTNLEWGAVSYLSYSKYGSTDVNTYSVYELNDDSYEMAIFDGNILGSASYEVGNSLDTYEDIVYRSNLFEISNSSQNYGFRNVLY